MDRPRAPKLLEPATTREAEPCDARANAPSRANVRSRRRAWRNSRHVWRGWDVVPRHAVEFVQPSLRTRRTCRIVQRFVRRRGNAASTRSEGACGCDSWDVRGASQNVHRNRPIDVDPRRWREEEGDGVDERHRSFPSRFLRSCSSHACARTAFDVCEDQVHGGVRTSLDHRYGVVQLQASWSCFHVVLRHRSSSSTSPRNLRWHGTRFDVLGTPPCTCASSSSVRRSTSIRRCHGVLPSPHMQQAAATTSSSSATLRPSWFRTSGFGGNETTKDRRVRNAKRDRWERAKTDRPPRACTETKHWNGRRRGGRRARARAATRMSEHASDGVGADELEGREIGRCRSIERGTKESVRGGTGGCDQSGGRKPGRSILCVLSPIRYRRREILLRNRANL